MQTLPDIGLMTRVGLSRHGSSSSVRSASLWLRSGPGTLSLTPVKVSHMNSLSCQPWRKSV